MKKNIISAYIILILALGAWIYKDWKALTRPASEEMLIAAEPHELPPVFQVAVRTEYPPLFDVSQPVKDDQGNSAGGSDAGTGGEGIDGKDQLHIPAGMLRVRAVFTKSDNWFALVELLSDRSDGFIEVRENDMIHGFQVVEIGADYILITSPEHNEPVKLVIFERDTEAKPGHTIPSGKTDKPSKSGSRGESGKIT